MHNSDRQVSSEQALKIVPGRGWLRFTYPRKDMELLGVVQRGMQIGAFARLASGAYAQVNGDVVQTLNAARVKVALRQARIPQYVEAPPCSAKPGPPPTITIKKRRHVAPS